ncbi:MAG: DUF3997 domain-containing protein [Bacteroidales bacterium]|jgi:hypothetical protein|nr:hypothetical protein [Bacteroidales bacterium]MDI9575954.1 hypothetical protein [Bacteroidota bacterium]MDD3755287.1 hypothetical protein [Bacteroidales bacterium]MDY0400913.1 hypothetical protein [Bacteroidales bacterium]HOB77669.1 hypothetical protein [Bacteroidales bacterium]
MDKIIFKLKNVLVLIIFYLIIIFNLNCTSDYSKNLGSGYIYRDEGCEEKEIFCEQANGGKIPKTVLVYDYDRHYIIAKQKPQKDDSNILLDDTIYEYKYGYDTLYYWIILKDFKKVIGPLTEDEFLKAIIKYKVSKTLKL